MVMAAPFQSITLGALRITYVPDGYGLLKPTGLWSTDIRPEQVPMERGAARVLAVEPSSYMHDHLCRLWMTTLCMQHRRQMVTP